MSPTVQRFVLVLALGALLSSVAAAEPPGLVSYWAADGDALDSADGNHGTLVNGTSFGPGKFGQAFSFDGVDDAVRLGNPPNLQLPDFTITAWIRRNHPSVAGFGSVPGASLVGFENSRSLFGLLDDGRLYLDGVGIYAVSTSAITDTSAFHHVAVTKAGSTVAFYLDGASVPATVQSGAFVLPTQLAIGYLGDPVLFPGPLFGLIDELRAYRRSLSAAEIQEVFALVPGTDAPQIGPTGHYYQFVPAGLDWEDARVAAENRVFMGVNGHLVTIGSQEENDFLLSLTSSLPPAVLQGGWIGMEALSSDITGWQWVTGEEVSFTRWHSFDPISPPASGYLSFGTLGVFRGFWLNAPDGLITFEDPVIGYFVEYEVPPVVNATQLGSTGHYYEFVPAGLDWEDARVAAESRVFMGVGGHLVTIGSQEENDFLGSIAPAPTAGFQGGWIGMAVNGGNRSWVTGEPLTFQYWGGIEPNNSPGSGYMHIGSANFAGIAPGRWADAANGLISGGDPVIGYFVEYEVSTGPTNQPPVCDLGGPYSFSCGGGPLSIQLDGSGSSDPDGTSVSHAWNVSCDGPSALDDPSSPTPTLTLLEPLCGNQSCSVGLTVSDGSLATPCLPQAMLVHPRESALDLSFDSAQTVVQIPPGTLSQVRLGLQNSGVCPAEVEIVDVDAVAASGMVSFVAIDPPLTQLSAVCAGPAEVVLDVDTRGIPENSYSFFVRVRAPDGSGVSSSLRIVVGAVRPDLTPISTVPPNLIITGDTGPAPLNVGEGATVSAQIRNVGAGAAGAYQVDFFANNALLGTVQGPAGLAPGASAPVQLALPAGLGEGTHVIRIVVASAPGAESDLSNNAVNGFVQVGAGAPGSGALIRVIPGATGACEDGIVRVSGTARYELTSGSTLVSFPVQGGITSVGIFPAGSGQPTLTGLPGHTDTQGRFSFELRAPAPGSYDAVVEVTDLTLAGSEQASLVVQGAAACTPPPPPPPPNPQQPLFLELATCERNAAGGPIAYDDRIFTLEDPGCPTGQIRARNVSVRASGTWSPVELGLEAALFEDDGAGGLAGGIYEQRTFSPVSVPFEMSLDAQSCRARPQSDGVVQLDVSDVAGVNSRVHRLTQLAPGSVSTNTIILDVEDLQPEAACSPTPRVYGRVRYVAAGGSFGQGIPLACGTVRATLLDPDTSQELSAHVSTTDAAGGFGVGLASLTRRDRDHTVRVEISDGVVRKTIVTTVRCSQSQGSGPGGGPAPSVSGTQQDLFVFAEDVLFLGDGTCSIGQSGTPEPGQELGIAATIHLEGADTPISQQTITVREHLPVNGVLTPSVIATPTVDFPAGVKQADICVPWTPQTRGYRIIQVDIDPDQIAQYPLNDAATRAIGIGRNPCALELSRRTVELDRGGSASLSLRNAHDEGFTPVLNLSLQPPAGQSLPPGLTGNFTSSTLVGDDTQLLTLETTAATPPGRFPLVIIADGTTCTALASVTAVVSGRGPDLDPIADQSLQCGALLVQVSASDPEGDALTLSASGLPGFVLFDDSGNGTGTLQINASSGDAGTYAGLSVTATDAYGFSGSQSFALSVTDRAPRVTPVGGAALSCLGGSIPVSASDDDGDALRLTLGGALPFIGLVDHLDGSGTIAVAAGIPGGLYDLEVVATDQTCGASASESFSLTVPGNELPSITPVDPQQVRAGESLALTVGASDFEGGLVNLSGIDLPAFAQLQPAGGGSWSLTLMPENSDVGTYDLELQALDACAGTSSISIELTVVPSNRPPTADAGADQTVSEGSDPVVLDGSGSADLDGDALTHAWVQLAGAPVVLSDPSAPQPSFAAPLVASDTTLTFELVVSDGSEASAPDTVNVTIANVNNPPVADAGDDTTIKEGAVAQLDGSSSYDPEGDTPLHYTWTQISGPSVALQPGATVVSPSFTAPQGVGTELAFELVVSDGQETGAPDSVTVRVVENSAPLANAGPDQTRDEGSPVSLEGSASSDPDGGDALTFQWVQISGPPVSLSDATSAAPMFIAPLAPAGGLDLEFRLVVTDDDPVNPKSSAPDTVTVSVTSINDPPRCDLGRSVCPESKFKAKGNVQGCIMWPPNHKLLSASIAGVTDEDSVFSDVTLRITGVTQDEPVNGGGDGDTSPDAILQSGAPVDSVLLRSERTGHGGARENGRVYVVHFTADDGLESCTGSVTVGVPHDRKDVPVDDGQFFDSTQP